MTGCARASQEVLKHGIDDGQQVLKPGMDDGQDMPHDKGDATACSTQHSAEPKVNLTNPTDTDCHISDNCSTFQTHLTKTLKFEEITESKWKESEKVKTQMKIGKKVADINDNFTEAEMVHRALFDSEHENEIELHSKQLKIGSVRMLC